MGRAGNSGREEGCRFLNMWHREVGVLAPRVFSRRAAASLFDSRAKTVTKLIKCSAIRQRALYIPYVSLRAIAIDPMNTNHFAAAGSDEFARVYDIRKCRLNENLYCNLVNCFCPPHLIRDREACITGLAFSGQSELMVSYKLEHIYLFSKDGGLGPMPFASPVVKEIHDEDGTPSFIFTKHSKVADALEFYTAHCRCNTVQGASFFGPNCEYVTSGSHCGHVFIWRKKGGKLLRVMDGGKGRVNCVEPHPSAAMLASSGTGKDIKVWIPNAEEPAVPEIDEAIRCHGKSCSEADEDADNLDDDDTNDSLDSDD